jgi:putative hydrolase of the HAD superfamily
MTKQYHAVFFDLDGTLRLPDPAPTTAFIHYARTLDVHIPTQTELYVKKWAHEYWGQDELIKQEMSRLGTEGFWINYSRLLLEAVNVRQNLLEQAVLVRQWFDQGYAPQITRAPHAYQMLKQLREEGYILGLISNRTTSLATAVAELELDGLFHFTLAAGEIGIWKPNPGIFTHALSRYPHLHPSQCLYIGDNYFADVRGAQAAGLVPILFDPEELYTDASCLRITHMNELRAIL